MPTLKRILVPVDFSACSRAALEYAASLAHILLGSVAEKVVRHASCPVLTVRLPDKAAASGRAS